MLRILLSAAVILVPSIACAQPSAFGQQFDRIAGQIAAQVSRAQPAPGDDQSVQNERAEIQRRLNALGFAAGTPDGDFGPRTRSAISGFQRSLGEAETGRITEEQIDRLFAATEDGAPGEPLEAQAATPDPAAPASAPATFSADAVARFGWMFRDGDIVLGLPRLAGLENLSKLLVIGTNRGIAKIPKISFDVGMIAPELIKPYLTERGLDQFERRSLRGSNAVNHPAWIGDDEFARDDTHKRFIEEAAARIGEMGVSLPVTIAYVRSVSIGDYSMSIGGFPLSVARWENGGLVSSLEGIADLEIPEPRDRLPELLPMSQEDGRKLRAVEREEESKLPDFRYVIDNDGSTYRQGGLVHITRYRLDRLTQDGGDMVGEITLLDAGLYGNSNLSAVLYPLSVKPERAPVAPTPAKPVTPKQPTAAELAAAAERKAIIEGTAEAPSARFDVFGISLGQPIDVAKAKLREQYKDLNPVELVAERGFDWNRLCEADIGRRYIDDKGSIRSEFDAGYFDAAELDRKLTELESGLTQRFIDAGCPPPARQAMAIAFGLSVDRGQGLKESAVIYQTTAGTPVVAAVFRGIDGDGYEEAFQQGLIEKYGAPDIDYDGSRHIWFDHPLMDVKESWHAPARCLESFDLGQVPGQWLGRNCGAFVATNGMAIFLTDTRYNAKTTILAAEEAKAADAATEKPKLAF